jgi:hypothetical protein
MMVFRFPKNICKGITGAISQFWWGDKGVVEALYTQRKRRDGLQRYGNL